MRIKKDNFLLTRPIAHRGLWGKGFTENSLSAYRNAAEKGYPIEIDLYLSTDGVLFSFHDKTLNRMTGESGYIYEKTAAELKSKTARVVVLKPPAVEPGEPPTSISRMVMSWLGGVI